MAVSAPWRVALIEAGSPGLNIYSHVAMGRGVALLGTVLRDAGYECRVFIEDVSGKDSVDWDFVAAADVVGFSAITCTLPRTAELIRTTREIAPHATVVMGGPEPTCAPMRSLSIGADYVLRGEAEVTLPIFLRALLGPSPTPLDAIPGLVWVDGGELHEGPAPVQLGRTQLDALPMLDRSLIHHGDMADVAPVWRARGCPERCSFCEVCEIWPRYVTRRDDQSLDEMMDAQRAGYSTVFLIDDNAAANKPAFMEFLRNVNARGYAQMLVTQIRADSVFRRDGRLDREFLRLLKKAAAVTVVCVGVESADDADLEAVGKHIDSSSMARALKAMRRCGLLVHGMFIALNEDSREVIERNARFARKCVTSLQYLFETPLPGTVRTHQHESRGSMLFSAIEDLALFDGMHVVLKPENMLPAEMQDLVFAAYRRFYSSRRVVAAALRGTFARFRRLTDAQRRYLRELRPRERIREWAWFHIEYKYAPVGFLEIGRRRMREMLADPSYVAYEARIRSL
jgi:radical SAM superfamily enzyme YgiQ (UPF0313 family)